MLNDKKCCNIYAILRTKRHCYVSYETVTLRMRRTAVQLGTVVGHSR